MAKRPEGHPPWLPYPWEKDPAGTAAIRAVDRGEADAAQQRLALTTIIEGICRYYDLSYRPDSERDTAFAEGMRFVGAQVIKISKLNVNNISKALGERHG